MERDRMFRVISILTQITHEHTLLNVMTWDVSAGLIPGAQTNHLYEPYLTERDEHYEDRRPLF